MTRRVYSLLMLGFVLVWTACVAPAFAAPEPTPNEIAVARQLFAEATALREKGRWREAAEKLRRAIGIKDTPGLRYHLGYCQAELGKLVEALVEYDRADEIIKSGVPAPDVERLLDVARDELRKRVPTLTIDVPAAMGDAVLEVDENQISRLLVGQPIPLNLGWHSVVVKAAGYEPFERRVQLREGQRVVLRVDSKPAPEAAAEPPDEPEPKPATKPVKKQIVRKADATGTSARTYVLLGEGSFTLLSAGFAVVFNFVGASAEDRMNRAQAVADAEYRRATPDAPVGDVAGYSCHEVDQGRASWVEACAALDESIDSRDRAELFQIAGYVGAGVGASALLATYLFWPSGQEPAVSLTAGPVESGFMATLRGRF